MLVDLKILYTELKRSKSDLRLCLNAIIGKVYILLFSSTNPHTLEMIEGWRADFQYLYGDIVSQISSNSKIDYKDILGRYGISPNSIALTLKSNSNDELPHHVLLLFYAIQTVYSILLKEIVAGAFSEPLVSNSKSTIRATNSNRNGSNDYIDASYVQDIILGTFVKKVGIQNYVYPDWFCWPIFEVDNNYSRGNNSDVEFCQNTVFVFIVSSIHTLLQRYKSDKSVEEYVAYNKVDYLKNMYEVLIPKELRHALGEFYSPDWLAEEITNTTMEYFGNDKVGGLTIGEYPRLIDPSCGSGTFVLKAIYKKIDKGASLSTILNTVAGTDINPLAVLTSKTNYILAILDFLIGKKRTSKSLELEIPIYNLDAIYSWYDKDLQEFNANCMLRTDNISSEDNSSSNNNQLRLTDLQNWYSQVQNKDFGESFKLCFSPKKEVLRYVAFDKLRAMEQPSYDGVIGNPPWVNWEYLPEAYREKTKFLWKEYQLFNIKGLDLSFSKEDISVILTYVVLDKFLSNGGILSFVIRQGIFKSVQNGVGFRRFRIKDECDVKVHRTDDLSQIKIFDYATVNTAIVYLQKGVANTYPVPYYLWQRINNNYNDVAMDDSDSIISKRKNFSIKSDTSLATIKEHFQLEKYSAMPTVANDLTSIWLTIPSEDTSAIKNCLGTNNYRARTGVFTGGANAVYWLNIKSSNQERVSTKKSVNNKGNIGDRSRISNSYILVENKIERARRKTSAISMAIEPDYIFPMVRGANIKKWQVDYDTYILCPHDIESKIWPVKGEILKKRSPKTFEYLRNFKKELDERKGFAGWEKNIQKEEFHAILRVGEYTFSKYKVVWKYIATEFICAVIGETEDPYLGTKMLLPNEKVMYVSTESEAEAYYLCGVLSSSIVAKCVKGFMNPTSISAHVLNKLNIPDFDPKNSIHIKISEACKSGHIVGNISKYASIVDDLVKDLLDNFQYC